MLPVLPILAWTGGITAGAQISRGVVRGAGQLARGRPTLALLEVADGLVSPFMHVYQQLAGLGADVVGAIRGAEPVAAPVLPQAPRRRRKDLKPKLRLATLNGMPELPTG